MIFEDDLALRVQRQTHRPHPSDWRHRWGHPEANLKYVGDQNGWYLAPACELDFGPGESCVYFAHAPDVGRVKIGCTTDLLQRLEALQNASPVRLIIVAAIEGDFSTERFLHERFADSRIHGEWFDDSILESL